MIPRRRLLALVLLAFFAAPASQGIAQRPPASPDQMNRQELLDQIQTRFQDQVARELELTEDQREQLPEILEAFAEDRRALVPVRREFIVRVRALLDREGAESEALALIHEGRALRAREEALLVREEERLLEILEPSQVLLLQQLRDQFEELIRSAGNRAAPEWLERGGRGGPQTPGAPRP